MRPEPGLPRISTRSPGPTSRRGGSSAMQPCRVSTRTASSVKRPAGSSLALDEAGAGLDGVELEQRLAEVHHPEQRRPPVGDGAGVVDEPAQRLLHLVEGADHHHQLAEAQPPGEIARRRHRRSGRPARPSRSRRSPRSGAPARRRSAAARATRVPRLASSPRRLVGLAVAERDALGALRALHQREAEIGLARVAVGPEPHQRAADPPGDERAGERHRGAPPRPCSRGSRGRGRRSG